MAADAQAEQKLAALKETAQVIRTRSCEVRYRGLATHALSPAPKIGRLRRTIGVNSVLTW